MSDEGVTRLVRSVRHPLRVALTVLAVVCAVASFAGASGLLGAVLGAALGVVVGELLGRSRLRLPLVLGLLAGALVVAGVGSWLLVRVPVFAIALGPGTVLHLSGFAWLAVALTTGLAALRALSVRRPALAPVELAALAGAFAVAFASHRNGAIARPLWLSDRAWRMGLDPADVLLVLGALFGLCLAGLALLESRRRPSLLVVAALPLLALLAVWALDPGDLQRPPEAAELAEIKQAMGDPPKPTDGPPLGGGATNDSDGEVQVGEPDQGEGPAGQGERGGEAEAEASGEPAGGDEAQGGSPDDGSSEDPGVADGGGSDGDEGERVGGEPREGEGDDEQDEPPPPKPPNPVAVVLLGDDYDPPSQGFYLRQEVMSEFNGSRLIPSTREGVDLDVLTHFPTHPEGVPVPATPVDRARVQASVALLVEHTAPFGLESPVAYAPARNPDPSRFVTAYDVESLSPVVPYEELLGRLAGDPSWTPEVLAHYTTAPADLRYAELAERLVADLPEKAAHDPFARALKIKLYLDENMQYSTRAKHAGVPDPTADFLFGDLIGYCVHSAHASVYLWRSVGIPARVGTGYMVDLEDRRGSSLVVMGADAHAWPELYLEGVGWVILDVAPSVNLDPPTPPVDEELVQMLSEMARAEPPRQQRSWDLSWLRRLALYGGGGLAAMAALGALGLLYTIKAWRRARVAFAGGRSLSRVGYRLALDLLSEAGHARMPGETRERFARRVASVSPSFSHMTDLHLAARLGVPRDGAPELSAVTWHRLLRGVRGELGAHTPSWRRLLGVVDPISFFRSR